VVKKEEIERNKATPFLLKSGKVAFALVVLFQEFDIEIIPVSQR
jgi:hypothetical protein